MKNLISLTITFLFLNNAMGICVPNELSSLKLDNDKTILTTSAGLTLYTFDVDDDGVSNCHDQCLAIWPAVSTNAASMAKPFGVHVRADKSKQITLNGKPLYTFASDKLPLETLGDGLGGVWHIVPVKALGK